MSLITARRRSPSRSGTACTERYGAAQARFKLASRVSEVSVGIHPRAQPLSATRYACQANALAERHRPVEQRRERMVCLRLLAELGLPSANAEMRRSAIAMSWSSSASTGSSSPMVACSVGPRRTCSGTVNSVGPKVRKRWRSGRHDLRPLSPPIPTAEQWFATEPAAYVLPKWDRHGTKRRDRSQPNCFSCAQAPLTRLKTKPLAGIEISVSKLPSGGFLFHTLRSRRCAEHAPKDRIDVLQVIAEVEQRFQRRHW